MLGRDLIAVLEGIAPLRRVRAAYTEDDYSARWGRFVLRGKDGKRPKLCHLDLDPTCAYDRSPFHPITTEAIFRSLADFEQQGGKPAEREPVTMDTDTAAQLSVWGAD
jgi:hypothetical protein